MKTLILNGAGALRDLADAVADGLQAELEARGQTVAHHHLADLKIPDCQGDFGCWTVTPGVCVHPGPHRDLARELVQSDLYRAFGNWSFRREAGKHGTRARLGERPYAQP